MAEWPDESQLQTLEVDGLPPGHEPRRRPRWALLVLSLVVAGAGAAVPRLAKPTAHADPIPGLRSAVEGIAVAIERAVDGTQMRADGMAETPVLRAAIGTDAATLQDLARTERLFHVDGNDTIEVFRIDRGALRSMVRLPASARPLHASAGTLLEAEGDSLVVTATVPVVAQNGGEGGVLALRRPCDLSSALAALPRALVAAVDRPAPTVSAWPSLARTACFIVGVLLLAAFGELGLRRRTDVRA